MLRQAAFSLVPPVVKLRYRKGCGGSLDEQNKGFVAYVTE